MCVVSAPVYYFYGQDLPKKHHTRLCDDGECESRVSALWGRRRSIGILKCWTPTCPGSFRGECTMDGMQISTKKTEVMLLSRQKKQCSVSVNGTPLNQVKKFKYFGVEFSNDARRDCEIDRRIGSASAILRSLYRSIVTKKEVSQRTKMAIFNAVYRPTLAYVYEQWVMTERIRSRIRAAEMRFLRRAASLTLRDRIHSSNDTRISEGRATSTLHRKITALLVGTRTKNAA